MACVHGFFEVIAKYVEFSVIGVCGQRLFTLETLYNQFDASLDVFHAHRIGLFLEGSELWFLVFYSVFALCLDKFHNLFPREIQIVVIERIEKPVLKMPTSIYSQKSQPVSGDCQHKVQD